ncbi:hypothetical protein P3X46_013874 [Hevea brasiliensis]|uniref:HTH OST-type domain-containing protein n=1 Tax=Hevea brasiliensis TaxID=3981 RepID=A0ABQ9M4V5_HEVBR|nr:uncharacterized protein LOC110654679 [Hevea brasiliensis]XP_021666442.2 uncharacterized protein LOC110654679 [Hevea brasiliensis]KAJ9175307.1 hypothetical protein P3X46_013874 [Hevea brasiliensis]
MANTNIPASVVPSDSSEQRGITTAESNTLAVQPPLDQQNRSSLDGPVAILWDIENCPVPSDVRPEDVAGNIRMALRVHPIIKGAVMMFSAYGDFNSFPRRLREGCQRTGVKLIDVPNGRKDAADKAILVDMFLFALDNPPPSSIMLISGDVDFAPALHILGQRGYIVILVIPSGVGVSYALSNAGKFVWDWPSVARGEGFVPPSKGLMPPYAGPADIAGYLVGCHINDNLDGQNEDDAVVYRGISQSYYNSRDFSSVSQSLSEYNCSSSINRPCFPTNIRSQSLPSGFNEVSAGPVFYDDQYHSTMWVQPGDINGLKVQLVKLLELSGGCLPLTRVPAEYQKIYGRPLYVSEYGAFKLVNLFKKMNDALTIDGKGQKKLVCLRNWKASPSAPPLVLARKDKKGKGTQEESLDAMTGGGSSDEFSDEERVVVEEQEESRNQGKVSTRTTARCEVNQNLGQFKYELQEILVSYSCRIFLGCFEAIYQQRYKKPLDYQRFGVDQLEELLNKMSDVVVLHEEPVSKRKYLAAVGG